ncbi:GIY-YIG nuclease family protein [Hymenobacter metallicola]|uniref:GIY-YIG domain-containing protein n=1 Tax=Hymenobacter metallicola TaxID=2563114 RepID=A0A4Z0Q0H7_9BACT|nr:GIY-YIG nuclease family protein [Hymenobacter metallicola]TGE23528.1 hypothetical protein E5K02_20295 [Hymenobacter metallicola]
MADTVFIYALKCPMTMHVRYVGKTKNLKKRLYSHIYEAKKGKQTHRHHWLSALAVIGQEPIMEVLEEAPLDQWQERERHYIRLYRSTGWLVNGTEGGDGLTPEKAREFWQNPEYRRKQVEAATGERNGFYGKTHSAETRKVLAEKCRHEVPWNKGKSGIYSKELILNNRLQKHRKPIARYKEGQFVDSWESARALCRELGWDRRHVQRVLQGTKHFNTIKGYTLAYTQSPAT